MNEKNLMGSAELKAYKLLHSVFIKNAYSSIELDKELSAISDDSEKGYLTRLFYGVLEKSVYLDYCIKSLCASFPKPSVAVILKIGLYLQLFMDVPDYAAVDKTVAVCHALGKSGVSGFVNALLRKVGSIPAPSGDNKTAVLCSIPDWLYGMLKKQYTDDFILSMFNAEKKLTHIRHNGLKISKDDFERKYRAFISQTSSLGYYVDGAALGKMENSDFTAQGLASMLAVHAYAQGLNGDSKVLDMCAAPGGKAVYLYELTKSNITACDLYPHRVSLINSYAKRMGADITANVRDATEYNADYQESFDAVICDVPCSGIGVVGSKPDILLNRKPEDIGVLSDLQFKILSLGAKYVKNGGSLHYSTCTVLKRENEKVVERFLQLNPDFVFKILPSPPFAKNEGTAKLYPHIHGTDGFFIVSLKKEKK